MSVTTQLESGINEQETVTCQEVQVSGPVFLARHGSVNLIENVLHIFLQQGHRTIIHLNIDTEIGS